jgi:hypothetical protein
MFIYRFQIQYPPMHILTKINLYIEKNIVVVSYNLYFIHKDIFCHQSIINNQIPPYPPEVAPRFIYEFLYAVYIYLNCKLLLKNAYNQTPNHNENKKKHYPKYPSTHVYFTHVLKKIYMYFKNFCSF